MYRNNINIEAKKEEAKQNLNKKEVHVDYIRIYSIIQKYNTIYIII